MIDPLRSIGSKAPEKLSGKPNEVWCGDITSIPTLEQGWLYLAGQLDLNTKRLTGWKLGESLESNLVMEAFRRAIKLWQVTPQIHHSDRGVLARRPKPEPTDGLAPSTILCHADGSIAHSDR